MFNLFGKKSSDYNPSEDLWKDLPGGYNVPSMPKVKPAKVSEDGYTVGVNNEGSTVLKITTNYNTVTLTMNEVGTLQLIRLLEATLTEEEEECQV